jgi:hypothetical protein
VAHIPPREARFDPQTENVLKQIMPAGMPTTALFGSRENFDELPDHDEIFATAVDARGISTERS